jgi:hypothetical protein
VPRNSLSEGQRTENRDMVIDVFLTYLLEGKAHWEIKLEVWLSGGVSQHFQADTTHIWTSYRVTVTVSV